MSHLHEKIKPRKEKLSIFHFCYSQREIMTTILKRKAKLIFVMALCVKYSLKTLFFNFNNLYIYIYQCYLAWVMLTYYNVIVTQRVNCWNSVTDWQMNCLETLRWTWKCLWLDPREPVIIQNSKSSIQHLLKNPQGLKILHMLTILQGLCSLLLSCYGMLETGPKLCQCG
jgi:hypothetical protein